MPAEHDSETDMPLIDRDALRAMIYGRVTKVGRSLGWVADTSADDVIAYLRSVLTPEALYPQPGLFFDGEAWVTRNDMHRRIFGEDQ